MGPGVREVAGTSQLVPVLIEEGKRMIAIAAGRKVADVR